VSGLPNLSRPEVDWVFANPAQELAALAESLGCRVVLGLDGRVAASGRFRGRPARRGPADAEFRDRPSHPPRFAAPGDGPHKVSDAVPSGSSRTREDRRNQADQQPELHARGGLGQRGLVRFRQRRRRRQSRAGPPHRVSLVPRQVQQLPSPPPGNFSLAVTTARSTACGRSASSADQVETSADVDEIGSPGLPRSAASTGTDRSTPKAFPQAAATGGRSRLTPSAALSALASRS
jgi:hypothetical protein